LATKAKKPAAKRSSTKVTRITATVDETPVKSTENTAPTEKKKKAPRAERSPLQAIATPFKAIGRYFAGSWYELRQVTWTDRKSTWSLTLAMLIFTGFFATLILLLDALFKYLFQLILG
jgi:preprotein translocase SecE subunit